MRNIIHRGRTATTARTAKGRKQAAGTPDPVSRMLTDLTHYLLVPGPLEPTEGSCRDRH
ncbi:hypothetical protein [Streptomyces sp. WAC06614]|uniref:hypothetical protein n=1 Tax=Streptomyces sp. WAC06614 TaxID=2487416 RepID=UPI00163D1A39|nr:hypothetical protein [Streptomyces sp. WAC06614]